MQLDAEARRSREHDAADRFDVPLAVLRVEPQAAALERRRLLDADLYLVVFKTRFVVSRIDAGR